jgi:ATP-dependent DNA ligase
MVVALDGDLLVHPDDLRMVLESDEEYIGGTTPSTDNPVLMSTQMTDEGRVVTGFSREKGEYEWTGLAQVRTDRLGSTEGHVYYLLEPLLPVKMAEIRTKEIDTMEDYRHAVAWVRNGYRD